MGAVYYDDPADGLYGPGNPDYENDQRDDADGEAAHNEDLLRQQDDQESQQ